MFSNSFHELEDKLNIKEIDKHQETIPLDDEAINLVEMMNQPYIADYGEMPRDSLAHQ